MEEEPAASGFGIDHYMLYVLQVQVRDGLDNKHVALKHW
jgi:hypothetical protein